MKKETEKLYAVAIALSVFTIIYNIAEGLLATYLGYCDESLTLFGFGVDSFIETVSGLGILHMVLRIKKNPESNRDNYERSALKITGFSFYALVAGLLISAINNLLTGQQPLVTLYGSIIATISILVMLLLVYYKSKTGKALGSEALLADAECTRVCIYMSIVLLVSNGIYYWFRFPYTDSIGAVVIAWFSYKEGKECFEKAHSDKVCSCSHTS